MVECIWVEVNTQVNYPIKAALIDVLEHGQISVDDDLDKFCVSWFTIKVAAVRIELFVAAWNEHPIPGVCPVLSLAYCISTLLKIELPVTKHGQQRGVPRMRMMSNNQAKHIDPGLLPTVANAVQQYQQQGGHSGGFRGVSEVSTETPFCCDCIIAHILRTRAADLLLISFIRHEVLALYSKHLRTPSAYAAIISLHLHVNSRN